MKALIFDLDGTLLNTIDDLHTAVNHAMQTFGYPLRSLAEVQAFVGDGLRMLIKRAAPGATPDAVIDALLAEMKSFYALHCCDMTVAYEGILPMLRAFQNHGIPMAVVSNKADMLVKKLCEHYFPGLFSFALGESASLPKKPAPDMVFAALQALDAQDAYYIGDSDVDVQTAKNAALPCFAVTWGFRTETVLRKAGAQFLFQSPKQLEKHVLGREMN